MITVIATTAGVFALGFALGWFIHCASCAIHHNHMKGKD